MFLRLHLVLHHRENVPHISQHTYVATRSYLSWEKVMDIEIHRKTRQRCGRNCIRRDITSVLYPDARNDVMAVNAIVSLWLMLAWIRNERARASLVSTSKPRGAVRRRICTRSVDDRNRFWQGNDLWLRI